METNKIHNMDIELGSMGDNNEVEGDLGMQERNIFSKQDEEAA